MSDSYYHYAESCIQVPRSDYEKLKAELVTAKQEREELLCGLEDELGTLGAEAVTNEQVLDAVKLAKDQWEDRIDMLESELAELRGRIADAETVWTDGKGCFDLGACNPPRCARCKQHKLLPIEKETLKEFPEIPPINCKGLPDVEKE